MRRFGPRRSSFLPVSRYRRAPFFLSTERSHRSRFGLHPFKNPNVTDIIQQSQSKNFKNPSEREKTEKKEQLPLPQREESFRQLFAVRVHKDILVPQVAEHLTRFLQTRFL